MKIIITLFTLILALPAFAEDQLPKEVKELISKRDQAKGKIHEQFNKALERLKNKYLKNRDLDGANAVAAIMEGKEIPVEKRKNDIKDELVGSSWTFLGINKQAINEFEFRADGSVKCDKEYREATWKRLDKDHILFRYAPGSSFIVFHADRGNMQGFHSSSGRARYLKKIK